MRGATFLTASAAALALLAVPAPGQVSPGFELVQITNTSYREDRPRVNNRGQIVYYVRFTGNANTGEVMLYDNGELIQITNNNVPDGYPDLNDAGTVVWPSFIGPNGPFGPTGEIMMYSNGVVTRLTNDDFDDSGPRINNLGHVVWDRMMGFGCAGGVFDIYFYDGQTIRPITTDAISEGVANEAATINDGDDIAWTRYDFCVSPWQSKIMLYSGGQTIQLSLPGEFAPQVAFINNLSQVGWSSRQANGRDASYIWEKGQVTLFTDWGTAPMLSDVGDIGFSRSNGVNGTVQAWLYRGETWFQLTDDPFNNWVHDIAGNGELTIVTGTYPDADISYLRRMPLGDLNCDGVFNGADIDPFFLALGDPNGYRVAFAECDPLLGDTNGDGSLNGADIDPFFACLGGGVCP